MLTESDLNIIDQYVNEKYFSKDKLIKYLNIHSIVGNEIFSYCDKRVGLDRSTSYSTWLNDKYGYVPGPVAVFIRRIPFYFYVNENLNEHVGDLNSYISSIRFNRAEKLLEKLYMSLEYMLYEKKLSLPDIFGYMTDQTHQTGKVDMFFQWEHYLQLCDELGCSDYLPNCFITSYNEILEKKGLPPIIYEIGEMVGGEVSRRNGTQVEFQGTFPCDHNGRPIMKWIGLRIKNARSISCSQNKSCSGRLVVELIPSTTIHALNCYNLEEDDENYWYQIYAGPQTMEFDHETLKVNRKRLNYTQREVADAIGATVRTYQKWENGETTPDGHYLLRLLNWLDIRDVQEVVRYTE
ncbi:helix-turn-helix domain-containing protein [Desulfitobacterium hafniense]|uniref:helix-turn-helix domain-containing protein n=1 Tax=Desulfitobacterium hafniense TaxID=49338 RepID=UPI000360F842|nr:helix-turn-helix transcriptional regulator [Desulfitobacterium hafniense]